MWLFNLIVEFLPTGLLDFLINAALSIGLIATIVGFFWPNLPLVAPYKLPIQIAGVALFTLGVYMKGSYETEIIWRAKVDAAEKRAKASEDKAPIINTVVQTKVVTQIKEVETVKHVIHDVIVTQEKVINAACTVAPEAISIHNMAAENKVSK